MLDPDGLNVWCDQRLVGYLWRNTQGLMGFRYDEGWLARGGFRVSHTLPLRHEEFAPEDGFAHRFFANLLPEGGVRERTVRDLKIPNTDFDLLRAIGGECAGALSVLQAEHKPSTEHRYHRITDEELAGLAARRGRIHTWTENERPRLSLAGAQDKCPVLVAEHTFWLPKKESPSSHILKFELSDYRHVPAYETFATLLARAIGLPVVDIRLQLVLMGDRGPSWFLDYGIAAFDGLGVVGQDPVEAGVPSLRDARALVEVATAVFGDVTLGGLEMDAVFHPMEYAATGGPRVTAQWTHVPSAACEDGYVELDVIDNLLEATLHYFYGNGVPVESGPETHASIRQSKRQQEAERRIREGTSEDPSMGRYPVESSKTFVGHTVVTYETTCEDSMCTTVFQGAVDDGYWDVNTAVPESLHDDPGTVAEFGGDPYAFIPFSWEITYPDPNAADD